MLQPALARDQHFLEHSRAEAQTVASINHPNVLVVHDSGVDDVPYLVTEYLAGGSLRGLLAAGHRLTPSQTLVVGLDACRGLAHAHGRGLVHRDLQRSEEHTSELQSLMRIPSAVICWNKKSNT